MNHNLPPLNLEMSLPLNAFTIYLLLIHLILHIFYETLPQTQRYPRKFYLMGRKAFPTRRCTPRTQVFTSLLCSAFYFYCVSLFISPVHELLEISSEVAPFQESCQSEFQPRLSSLNGWLFDKSWTKWAFFFKKNKFSVFNLDVSLHIVR